MKGLLQLKPSGLNLPRCVIQLEPIQSINVTRCASTRNGTTFHFKSTDTLIMAVLWAELKQQNETWLQIQVLLLTIHNLSTKQMQKLKCGIISLTLLTVRASLWTPQNLSVKDVLHLRRPREPTCPTQQSISPTDMLTFEELPVSECDRQHNYIMPMPLNVSQTIVIYLVISKHFSPSDLDEAIKGSDNCFCFVLFFPFLANLPIEQTSLFAYITVTQVTITLP